MYLYYVCVMWLAIYKSALVLLKLHRISVCGTIVALLFEMAENCCGSLAM